MYGIDTKTPLTKALSRKGRGNFPSLDGQCYRIKILYRPFRAKILLNPYPRVVALGHTLSALRALFQRKKILSPENGGIRRVFWLCHAGNNVVFWEIN